MKIFELTLLGLLAFITTVENNTNICLKGDFNDQVLDILNSVLMTEEEQKKLNQAYNDIMITLKALWPESKLIRYGSTLMGLGIKSSDVDLYLSIPEQETFNFNKTFDKALKVLKKRSHLFGKFKSKNPPSGLLLNFIHLPTGTECDVNFHVPYVFKQSQLIAYMLQIDKRALDFTILLKIWGMIHDLTGGENDIPNYSMTVLGIFYLQQKGILPSVALLQRNVEPLMIGDWNVAFDAVQHKYENKESLYDLLGGFFEYFSALDFDKYVLSPHLGRCIDRKKFNNMNELPDDLSLYKTNVRNNKTAPLKFTEITVQDIFVLTENAMRHRYGIPYFDDLFKQFGKAAAIYNESKKNDFLRVILMRHDRITNISGDTFWMPEISTVQDCT